MVGFVAGLGFLMDLLGFWGAVAFGRNMFEICCCCFFDGAVGFFGGDGVPEDCIVFCLNGSFGGGNMWY